MTAVNFRIAFSMADLPRDEPFLDERQCEVRARPVESGPCRVERPDLMEDRAIDVYGNEELEVV